DSGKPQARTPMRRRWVIWSVFFVAWTIGLLVPMPEITESWALSVKFLIAKTLHVTAYAMLAVLSGWLRVAPRFRWLLLFVIMVHATATELIQQHVHGRRGA